MSTTTDGTNIAVFLSGPVWLKEPEPGLPGKSRTRVYETVVWTDPAENLSAPVTIHYFLQNDVPEPEVDAIAHVVGKVQLPKKATDRILIDAVSIASFGTEVSTSEAVQTNLAICPFIMVTGYVGTRDEGSRTFDIEGRVYVANDYHPTAIRCIFRSAIFQKQKVPPAGTLVQVSGALRCRGWSQAAFNAATAEQHTSPLEMQMLSMTYFNMLGGGSGRADKGSAFSPAKKGGWGNIKNLPTPSTPTAGPSLSINPVTPTKRKAAASTEEEESSEDDIEDLEEPPPSPEPTVTTKGKGKGKAKESAKSSRHGTQSKTETVKAETEDDDAMVKPKATRSTRSSKKTKSE